MWRVRDLESPRAPESKSLAWLRCDSFEVVEELESWRSFGSHGAEVAELLLEAEDLDQVQVDVIAAKDGEREWQTRNTVDKRWLTSHPQSLSFGGAAGWGGVHLEVAVNLAAARISERLFGWVDEARESPVLADPSWRTAVRAAIAMMTAISAPELLEEDEFVVLTARWQAARHT